MDTNRLQEQFKIQRLWDSIDSYGREYVPKGTGEMQKQSFVDPGNVKSIVDFKVLDEGCETWVEGEKYPMRGCFQNDRIAILHKIKRLIPVFTATFKNSRILTALYFLKNGKEYLDYIHFSLEDVFYPDVKYYCQPVREIYRAMSGHEIDKIRDIVCAILEFDVAYRYRAQDILVEGEIFSLVRNPIAELKRLTGILSKRESPEGDAAMRKFIKLAPYIFIWLRFKKKSLGKIKAILIALDKNNIVSSVEDRYWQDHGEYGESYHFRGLHYKLRENKA